MLCYKKSFLLYGTSRKKNDFIGIKANNQQLQLNQMDFQWFSDSAKTLQSSPVAPYKFFSG